MVIAFVKKHTKIALIAALIIVFLIANALKMDVVLNILGVIFVIAIYTYMTREALVNLKTCLFYLLFIAPVLSAMISHFLNMSGYIPNWPFMNYAVFMLSYFSVWALIIYFGRLKTVKLATLIIAQVCTAICLIFNVVIYMIPIDAFNYANVYSANDLNIIKNIYGLDLRKMIELAFQFVVYPPLIIALLTYLIAELKEYKEG